MPALPHAALQPPWSSARISRLSGSMEVKTWPELTSRSSPGFYLQHKDQLVVESRYDRSDYSGLVCANRRRKQFWRHLLLWRVRNDAMATLDTGSVKWNILPDSNGLTESVFHIATMVK